MPAKGRFWTLVKEERSKGEKQLDKQVTSGITSITYKAATLAEEIQKTIKGKVMHIDERAKVVIT